MRSLSGSKADMRHIKKALETGTSNDQIVHVLFKRINDPAYKNLNLDDLQMYGPNQVKLETI